MLHDWGQRQGGIAQILHGNWVFDYQWAVTFLRVTLEKHVSMKRTDGQGTEDLLLSVVFALKRDGQAADRAVRPGEQGRADCDGTLNEAKDGRAVKKAKKALVVGAHPDDCALGASGFSCLLRRTGWQITFLTMTDGELGGNPLVRLEEERASAALLDVAVDFGHLPDGSMSGRETVEVLEAKLEVHQPDLILVHAPTDSHADHRVLSDSLVSAARRSASVLFYEGPSTLQFNAALKIDIATVWDLKVKSLLAHESQRERVRTVEWAEAAGRHRAWPHYRGICEAFSPVRMNLELMVEVATQARLPLFPMDTAYGEMQPSPAVWSIV